MPSPRRESGLWAPVTMMVEPERTSMRRSVSLGVLDQKGLAALLRRSQMMRLDWLSFGAT